MFLQVPDCKAPLPTKPSVLTPPNSSHRPASPSSSSGLTPSPELRHSPLTPPTLEELKNQLRDLRSSVELLKSQHRYIMRTWSTASGWIGVSLLMCLCLFVYLRQEMKQLSNALDDEKRIRVSLQVRLMKEWRVTSKKHKRCHHGHWKRETLCRLKQLLIIFRKV